MSEQATKNQMYTALIKMAKRLIRGGVKVKNFKQAILMGAYYGIIEEYTSRNLSEIFTYIERGIEIGQLDLLVERINKKIKEQKHEKTQI